MTRPAPIPAADTNAAEPTETSPETPNPNAATTELEAALTGTWLRPTYPGDQIFFEGERMKFLPGEGYAEEPTFEGFSVAARCPDGTTATLGGVLLVMQGGTCQAVRLSGDTLYLGTGQADGTEIAFVRQ